jgi:hypothetical protein
VRLGWFVSGFDTFSAMVLPSVALSAQVIAIVDAHDAIEHARSHPVGLYPHGAAKGRLKERSYGAMRSGTR